MDNPLETGAPYSVFVLYENGTWAQPTYRPVRPMTEGEFETMVRADCGRHVVYVCGVCLDPDCPEDSARPIGED